MDIEDYKDTVLYYKKLDGRVPLVIIDYIQNFPININASLDTKKVIDGFYTSLLSFTARNQIPTILVSSINRAAYGGDVDLGAFKETGSLEIGAITASILVKKDANNVNFHLIKNRFGGTSTISLGFDGANSRFYEKTSTAFASAVSKSSAKAPSDVILSF